MFIQVSAFLPEKFEESQFYWYYDTEAHCKDDDVSTDKTIRSNLSKFFLDKLPKETELEQLEKKNEKLENEKEQLENKVKELEEQLEVTSYIFFKYE